MAGTRQPRIKAAHFKAIDARLETDLLSSLLLLRTTDEARRFFYDLCTPKEIADMADRWLVARLLDEGKLSYRDIHKQTGVSVTTVGRVARFLQQESFQGYRMILDRRSAKHKKSA